MKNLYRVGLASVAGIALISLSGLGPVATAASASAAPASSMKITGLTFVEADVSLPANGYSFTAAFCPDGDVVVGGGGYETTQGLGENISTSVPNGSGSQWIVGFNNGESFSNTGVAVAICAASSSLANYSIQYSANVAIPANGEAQGIAACPSGTVSLTGGANVFGDTANQAMDASAPYGTNGWRVYMSSVGPDGSTGFVRVACATEPKGWAQVSSAYKSNPADTATNVSVDCPAGTDVLGGGPFKSSPSPEVTIGLTTSLSNLEGWHSNEDNNSSTAESVDEWAVCARAKRGSS
jgi:hypothetical protein